MTKFMEIRCIHAMDEMIADMMKYNVKHGIQRNRCIQNVGQAFQEELRRQCLPHKVTGNLDRSIVCKPRKGGKEWRIFALHRIYRLEHGTPISKKFGGVPGADVGVYGRKGYGVLRKKLKDYASHAKYARAGGVKNLANTLMTHGTRKYSVITKAKAKVSSIIAEESFRFIEQEGVGLKEKYEKKTGK